MKIIIKLLKVILFLALCFGLWVGGNIIFATITDYNPPKEEMLDVHRTSTKVPDSIFTFLTWNIGYGGLGVKADFFYDGGHTVVSPKEDVEHYVDGICSTVKSADSVNFILIQEVDTLAHRSYHINELQRLAASVPDHVYSFATNYNVKFVPIPFQDPMGQVLAGLASFSSFLPSEAKRHSYSSQFPWPKRVYFLDRCYLLNRIPLPSGKELLVINTHNSAYDKTGNLKKAEMDDLKAFLLAEYQKGNYIVVGGDWNESPPDFDTDKFNKGKEEKYPSPNFEKDLMPEGWIWAYDSSRPTNRNLVAAYNKEKTSTTIIDFFLVSPNLTIEEVKQLDIDFAYSDHNPVFMKVKMKKES